MYSAYIPEPQNTQLAAALPDRAVLSTQQSCRVPDAMFLMKGWNMAGQADALHELKKVDIAFTIERDFFGGWGLTLRAIRPARPTDHAD